MPDEIKISQTVEKESSINDFSNVSFPQVENKEEKLKIFSKILFANNIKINLDRRNGQVTYPINYEKTADLYKEIYESILKASNGQYINDILDSPLLNLSSSAEIPAELAASFPKFGKPNILSLKLQSKQTKACLAKGFPDTHLLKTEDLKKQIMEYYKKYSAFDKEKPTDGSQTEELSALERAKLFASIDLFFRVVVAEYYLRGIYVFGKQKAKDVKKEVISAFLYNAFLKEKLLKRFAKVTKNYKYLFMYYKENTSKETTNIEEVIRYLIEKNIDIIATNIDKKIKAANFSTADKEIDINKSLLDKLIEDLPFTTIDDATKIITFNQNYYNTFPKSVDTTGTKIAVTPNNPTKFMIARKPNQRKNEYYLCAYTLKPESEINIKDEMRFNEDTGQIISQGGSIVKSLDPFNAFRYSYPAPQNILARFGNKVLVTVLTKIKLKDDYTLDKTDKISKLLEANFNSLVDTKQTLNYLTVLAMSQVSLTKDIDKIFNITKRRLLTTIEYITNNGFYYESEYKEEDSAAFSFSVIIKAAINIPKVIVKGLAEAIDPNIAISSKVSLLVRIIKELLGAIDQPDVKEALKKIPDIPVPIISLPLGFTFPFFFTPLTIIYLILLGFDFDSDEQDKNNQAKAADGEQECEQE